GRAARSSAVTAGARRTTRSFSALVGGAACEGRKDTRDGRRENDLGNDPRFSALHEISPGATREGRRSVPAALPFKHTARAATFERFDREPNGHFCLIEAARDPHRLRRQKTRSSSEKQNGRARNEREDDADCERNDR